MAHRFLLAPKNYSMSLLEKSLTPLFRRKPESKIACESWIPGRASLARNDDCPVLSRVLEKFSMYQIIFIGARVIGQQDRG
jgi:hypothetical protein